MDCAYLVNMHRALGDPDTLEAHRDDMLLDPTIAAAEADTAQPMRCTQCGDVIGVYEPLVLLSNHRARITSAAAEPQIAEEPGTLFHRACCEQPQPETITRRVWPAPTEAK